MSEQSFEEMLDETFKTIHTGEVVDGTVIDVRKPICPLYRQNIRLPCRKV